MGACSCRVVASGRAERLGGQVRLVPLGSAWAGCASGDSIFFCIADVIKINTMENKKIKQE